MGATLLRSPTLVRLSTPLPLLVATLPLPLSTLPTPSTLPLLPTPSTPLPLSTLSTTDLPTVLLPTVALSTTDKQLRKAGCRGVVSWVDQQLQQPRQMPNRPKKVCSSW